MHKISEGDSTSYNRWKVIIELKPSTHNNNKGEQFMSFKENGEIFAGTKFSEKFRHR